MLPRRLRLSRRTFPSSRAGIRLSSEHFSLIAGVSTQGGCAAVVSKQVARRSVDRHLLKRRMLSIIRPWCTKQQFLVAYARSGSTTLSFRDMKAELITLLESSDFRRHRS